MSRSSMLAVALATSLLAPACTELELEPGPDPEIASDQQEIIGGAFDPADPAVVMLGGFCTGTLVSPRVVLTAAHCVADYVEDGNTDASFVAFGNGEDPWVESIDIIDMAIHRLYDPPAFLQWDIAAVRLAEPAPVEIDPVPFNDEPLTAEDIGLSVRVIGFGVTDGAAQTGFGTKRQVTLTLDEIDFYHIGMGTTASNTCQGDSGGPTMGTFEEGERVIGVTSFGSDECRARSYMTRVDTMQDWIIPVMDAWDGPCSLDGTCVEEGCRSIDPDCDECGFDGTCGTECPAVDLDCPIAARAGELCEDLYGCESRVCVVAPDDDRVSYCSATCDPERPLETCPPPLSACVDGPDGPVCQYNGPSKSAQGWPCASNDDCRSGMCEQGEGICVEACGDGQPECADPWSCESGVCLTPSDGGSCAAGGEGGGMLALLGGLGLIAWAIRRRGARGVG